MIYYPEGHSRSAFPRAPFTLAELERATNDGTILEATAILCDSMQNLTVSLGTMKGIIPKEEALYSPVGDVKNIAVITRVGKDICFKVKEIRRDENGTPYAILSRKDAQKECFEHIVENYSPGKVIPAKVTHLEPFGAFVDVGCGIVSMISIENISVSRISHPSQRFYVGDEIFCAVTCIDSTAYRIYVTHRELLGTWEENASLFCAGQTAAGTVRGIEDYGIFIELAPNLTGLAEYRDGVYEGQTACVYIKNIIPEKMKIKLIIVDCFDRDTSPVPMNYYVTDGVIDRWQYSPDLCEKIVETVFS